MHTTGLHFYNSVVAWEDAQNSQETSYQYSDDTHPDRLAQTVYPDGGTVTVTFNTDGTVASSTNQRNTVFTYDYDAAKRPLTEYADSTARVNYEYDALGRLTSLEETLYSATVSWTYTREADGGLQVVETQALTGHTDRTVTALYDLAGRLKSLGYPSGLTLTYDYDDLGRAVSVNDGTVDRVADTYAGGMLARRDYANGAYLTCLDPLTTLGAGYGENLSGVSRCVRLGRSAPGDACGSSRTGYDESAVSSLPASGGNRRWPDSSDDLSLGIRFAATWRRVDSAPGLHWLVARL